MRIATYEDILIGIDQDIPYREEDRIIGLILKNQAGGTITHGLNSNNPVKQLLAGEEFPYGGLHGYYITGKLSIRGCTSASNIVITVVRDQTIDTTQQDC